MAGQNGISSRQYFILAFGLTVGTSILVTPSGLALQAKADAWLGSLFSLALNLLMAGIYLWLARIYPGKNLFEIHEAILGKLLGKVLNFSYLFYFLILTGTLLGNLGFFITSEVMPETPIEAIQLLFLLAAVISARLGIVVLSRVGEVVYPWIILLFIVLIVTLIPQINWHHIMPMMENGLGPIMKAGFHASMFQEIIVLIVFISLLNSLSSAGRALTFGTLTGGILLTLIVLLSILVLGVEQTENSTFPAFALAKTINLGNFFQRVEGILIMLWILTFFIKISLLFLAMLSALQSIFRSQLQTPYVYPLAVLIIIVAWNTYINTVYIGFVIQQTWVGYAMLHLLVVPLALLAVGYCKTKWFSRKMSS